jgi:hypothetical protein
VQGEAPPPRRPQASRLISTDGLAQQRYGAAPGTGLLADDEQQVDRGVVVAHLHPLVGRDQIARAYLEIARVAEDWAVRNPAKPRPWTTGSGARAATRLPGSAAPPAPTGYVVLMALISRVLWYATRAARPAAAAPHPGRRARPWGEEVRSAYYEELGLSERAALLSWLGFTATFAAVRGITHSIKDNEGPFRNLSTGGVHLHHYLWGIAMLTGVGGVAVHGEDKWRTHPGVALTYGVGLALIMDEFALLVDLEDVYWSTKGRLSVEAGVGVISMGGTVFAALPMLRRLAHTAKSAER